MYSASGELANMDGLFGTEIIVVLQSAFSPTLDLLFILFTLLGEDYVYLSLIAIMFWCFNKRGGVRMAYLLLVSAYLNYGLKMAFNMDKPPSEYRIIQKDDLSYGFPSGHTQNAVTFWGWIGFKSRRAWRRIFYFTLIFLIGLSRIYLGVHYLGDVLGGLLFGAAFLIGTYKTVPYLEKQLNRIPRMLRDYLLPFISLLLFGISLAVFPDTTRGDSALICGSLFGFSLGVPLESRHVNISMDISRRAKVIRSMVGLATVFGLYTITSFGSNSLSFVTLVYMQFVRYAIVAFTMVFIVPLILKFVGT
jgi:membrane-associated phospholipid phosphatase